MSSCLAVLPLYVSAWLSVCVFIHSSYFCSAFSSPLLLRGAPDTRHNTDTVSEFHAEAPQAIVSEGLAQGPYVAARAGFKLTTFRTTGDEFTNEPPRPTKFYVCLSAYFHTFLFVCLFVYPILSVGLTPFVCLFLHLSVNSES